MKQERLIIYAKIDELKVAEHPNQSIYEDTSDQDFEESIKTLGVLEPIVLSRNTNWYGKNAHIIVSGHRRLKSAIKAGISEIPVRYENFISEDDIDIQHIHFNKQRKKTNAIKAAEIEVWKQKLSHIRKVLISKGVKGLEHLVNDTMLSRVKSDENGKPYLSTIDVIAEETGISKRTQEALNVIFSSDWLDDKCEKIWNAPFPEKKRRKTIDIFAKLVNDARTAVDDANKEEITVNKAYNEIRRVWRDIEAQISPEKKQKVKTKKNVKTQGLAPQKTNDKLLIAKFANVHPGFSVKGKVLELTGDDFDECSGILLDFGKNGKIFFDLKEFLKNHNLKHEK